MDYKPLNNLDRYQALCDNKKLCRDCMHFAVYGHQACPVNGYNYQDLDQFGFCMFNAPANGTANSTVAGKWCLEGFIGADGKPHGEY
jgi:hypothetical protein